MSESHQAYLRFVAADEAWMKQISLSLKGRPGDIRYTKEANGNPGTELNKAYLEFVEARENFWSVTASLK